MLVLTRKMKEAIVIGDGKITVKVVGINGDRVSLGIEAPLYVSVHRKEVYDKIEKEGKRPPRK